MATQQIKEILDQEIPTPSFSFLAAPDVGNLPEPITHSRSSEAWRYNARGRLKKFGSGEVPHDYNPRTGEYIGVAPQNYTVTNYCTHSAEINQTDWTASSLTQQSSNIESMFEQKSNAYLQEGSGNIKQTIGNFNTDGEQEIVSAIIEQNTSPEAKVVVDEVSQGGVNIAVLKYDFSTDSLSVLGGEITNSFARVLRDNGPNGGKVVRLVARYDPANSSGADFPGNSRRLILYPDSSGGTGKTIFHHAQVTQRHYSAPVISGASPNSTAADSLDMDAGNASYWNERQFSILVDVRMITRGEDFLQVLDGRDFTNRLASIDADQSVMRTAGGSFGNKLSSPGGSVPDRTKSNLIGVSMNRTGDVTIAANGESSTATGRDTTSYLGGGYASFPVLKDGIRRGAIKKIKFWPKRISVSKLETLTT
jgi:hypothetical protein